MAYMPVSYETRSALARTYASGRWKFSADVYDPNDLSVRLRGQYALTPNLFLTGQSIFPHNNRGGGEYIGVGYNY